MKHANQSKEYKTPQFQLVRQDEQNKAFFTASGSSPAPAGTTGSITSMTINANTQW